MAPKPKQTKEKIAAAAAAAGKSKKKKWSKGKAKDKLNNSVFFDKPTYDKMISEIPKSKLITPSIISEKLRISVSLAREAITELERQNLIRLVGSRSSKQLIYTRNTKDTGPVEEKPVQVKGKTQKTKKGKKGQAAEEEEVEA